MRPKPTADEVTFINTHGFLTFDWKKSRFTLSLNTDPEGTPKFQMSELGEAPLLCSIGGHITAGPDPRAVITEGAHPEPEFMLQLLKLMLGMMNLPNIGVATLTITSESGPN